MSDSELIENVMHVNRRGGQDTLTLPFELPTIEYSNISGGGSNLCRHKFQNAKVHLKFSHIGKSVAGVGTRRDTVLVYSFTMILRTSISYLEIPNMMTLTIGEPITLEKITSFAAITYQQYCTANPTFLIPDQPKLKYDIPDEPLELGWGD